MYTTRSSLLKRVKENDTAAWQEFDTLYRPMLGRLARRCGLSEADAEDVTQFCMMSIAQHIHSFEYDPKKGRFKGWLKTMVNNRIRNLHRRQREQTAVSQDFKRPQQQERSAEELFDEVWMEEHLRHCLKLIRIEVEPASFDAFRRHVLEECPVQQVCEELQMTSNQVYKIKWRLTQKLSEKMRELLDDTE